MGQPRLADEDCHQGRTGVVNNDTLFEVTHYPQSILQLMGLGDGRVTGQSCGYPAATQVQVLAQTQHHSDGGTGVYPWAYSTPHLHQQQQHEYARSQPPSVEYFTHRIPSIANKRNSSWNNKNSGRYPRQSRDDTSSFRSESSPNSQLKTLSYESLTELGLSDSKSIKRHHHEAYSIPPYPPPNYYQPYGQDFVSNSYQQHTHQQYTTYYNNNSQVKRRYNGRNSSSYNSGTRVIAIAPDRFLSRAHLLHVTGTPSQLMTGGQWDKLSEAIWNKFIANQQTEDMFRKKMLLWRQLYLHIKTTYPRYGLYLVGSTMSGLGSKSSDVDMCLLVRHSEMDQRCEAVFHLDLVLNHLRNCDDIENVELIQAKVPILKFRDAKHGLEVDLNCNNAVGIRNTHLLYCYSNMDWRVRPLVLVVKLWAQRQGINDAKNMTISSYSLALMVINYLQCGASPAVLPSLQLMYPNKFHTNSLIPQIDLHEVLPHHHTENKQTLGELMLGFLEYYSNHFDFGQVAASVRLASTISIEECRRARSLKNDPHQWKYLCIEEPFELTNTARSVYDRAVFEQIKGVFINSWLKMKATHSLDSIFELPTSTKSK